ncbi:hypothetical protein [Streptomyces sp. NPDC088923]
MTESHAIENTQSTGPTESETFEALVHNEYDRPQTCLLPTTR